MPPPFRPGPIGRRAARALYGGQPLALPASTTLQATLVTATTASLNGSVNPNGLATTWHFAYGTTPQYGSVTPNVSAGAGSVPVTVNATITGLTTAATYHFALVSVSAAGTVFGSDQTFVAQTAQPVTIATSPLEPVGAALVAIPHFAFPFAMTTTGAKVVEQDTLAEVFACVQAIANCPVGACPELPTFGVPDLTFGQAPLDPAPLVAAVKRWEPRADETAVTRALNDTGDTWAVQLTTGTIGTTEGA